MGLDHCPYCPTVSHAKQARSMINRHIKLEAEKPVPSGNHPRKGSAEWEIVSAARGFREKAATLEERKDKTSQRNYKYMDKRRPEDEKKVRNAFKTLQ